jgi:two-component system, NtrC family, nitrogen regulation sensor histidine kinase GlnL
VPPSTHPSKKAARNLWRDIVDGLADAVIVIDSDLKPVAVNPAAENMLGVSQVGRSVFASIIRHNEWLGRMLHDCLETGQNLGDPEASFNIGPRAVIVRVEISPLAGPDEHIGGAIILLHDLSHQKSAEHAVEGPTHLRLSPAGLAHEVKNPLTGIKGAAELLAGMYPTEPRTQQYCDVIKDGVNRIATLVEQVLAVSAPRSLKQDEINIHKVIHQALKMAGLFPKPPPEIILEQEFDPSLPDVIGDEAALERALLNLIRNAAEAMDNHGRLRIRTRMETEFRLTSSGGKKRQLLRVEVIDSGRGLTESELDQLFTPFFTTKPSGTGLGLVLSQRVVSLHGGKLWAERGGVEGPETSTNPEARSRGMSFKITLPVKGQG